MSAQTPTSPWRSKAPKPKKAKGVTGIASLNGKWGYLFTAPFFVMFLIFGLAPIVYSTYIAFFRWDPLGDQAFNGLENFTNLLQDDHFWNALRNTLNIWA
ncbi:MAG: hypothetical protein RLZZ626_446, partial [Actinomycetota bacterium]